MEELPLIRLYRADRLCADLARRSAALPDQIEALRREGHEQSVAEQRRRDELADQKESLRLGEKEAERERLKLEQLRGRESRIGSMKELEALRHEISLVKDSLDAREDSILELIEAIELAEREAALREPLALSRTEKLAEELEELQQALAVLKHETEKAERDRRACLDEVDGATSRRYERLSTRYGYGALAALNDGSCGGCRVDLPMQKVPDARNSGSPLECQECGRMLIWLTEE